MGLHVTTRLIKGFSVSRKPITETKTKYCEDTGRPYEVSTNTDRVQIKVGDYVVCQKHSDWLCDGDHVAGLELYCPGFHGEGDEWLLGYTQAECDMEGRNLTMPDPNPVFEEAIKQIEQSSGESADIFLTMSGG